jgi:hypothetical protein
MGVHCKGLAIFFLLLTSLYLTSCSPLINSVEHAKMDTDVKMSKTIFLTPTPDRRTIYLRSTNTSSNQFISFGDKLRSILTENGYKIIDDPDKADYVLYTNVLFVDDIKQFKATEGAYEGSAFGSLAGAGAISPDLEGALIGWAVGATAGAATGLLLPVKTFAGVVDIKVIERRKGEENEYDTQIAVKATQTRLNEEEAATIISGKLAEQVAAMLL